MLREIMCERFSQNKITFHKGLNVVLGDDQASNSIGKSSLLMVIDFVFGGNSLVTVRQDIVENLGNHAYKFCLYFQGESFYFKRETYDPKVVYKCDENYEDQEIISIAEYTDFLSKKYGVTIKHLTFRAMVSPYSRIWSKGNDDVKKPLNADKKQKEIEAVKNLIKLFEKYEGIEELEKQWKELKASKKSLADALKNEHIPQINKKDYNSNEKRMGLIDSEITEIKKNLASHACTIKELINRDILDLKEEKDSLLEEKMSVENRLSRIDRNLNSHSFLRSRNVEKLKEFFPDVNVHKISEIESFHEGIKKILEKELKASKRSLLSELGDLEQAVGQINQKISGLINAEVDNPSQIIDRVVSLNSERHKINQENFFYDRKHIVAENSKEIKERFLAEKQKVCDAVSGAVNNKVRQITTNLYSKDRHAAKLKIMGNSYLYETYEDTGTGKAYSGLIIFDLAVFSMTDLPFIVHDSILFKNIENEAVSKLVQYYGSDKQVFISIDEIQKYGKATENFLNNCRVIKLNENNQLYDKDWR